VTYEGNCRLGDLFTSRRERGRPGLPTLSVTLNDGLVNREDLDRKQETNLAPEEHLLVKPGDIAYNMMRMWQGAFGLADKEGIVSPAYVVLKSKAGIDPVYATYLLKSPRMIYLLWAYSYGLTEDRLRLYFDDFAKIPTQLHSPVDQIRLAKIFTATDAQIRASMNLLMNTKATKAAVLNKLIKPRSRRQQTGWTEFEFGEIVTRVREQFNPGNAENQEWCIELEHIDQESGQLCGHTVTGRSSSMKSCFQAGDVLFGKLRPYLKKFWLSNRAGVCSSEIWVLRPNATVCAPDYLTCLLQSEQVMRAVAASAGSKMPRAEWDFVERTTVLLPSLSEQQKIAEILDPLDKYVRQLGKYVEGLKAEQRGLIQKLFSPDRVHTVLELA